jgi:signal transduction histidine kinase
MSLPLILHGRVIALLLLSRRRDPPFEERDAEGLSSFALLAALLLRNVRLLDDAKELSLTKSRFLNMAAHELRTPLSVIRGYLDMLQAGNLGELPPNQAAAVDIVLEKSTELSEHVERCSRQLGWRPAPGARPSGPWTSPSWPPRPSSGPSRGLGWPLMWL